MDSPQNKHTDERIHPNDSKTKLPRCALCHEPFQEKDSLITLIEGSSPLCEKCHSQFPILDFQDKFGDVRFWILYQRNSSLQEWVDLLKSSPDVDTMKGIVYPLKPFIEDYVHSCNLIFDNPYEMDDNFSLLDWKKILFSKPLFSRWVTKGNVGMIKGNQVVWIDQNNKAKRSVFIVFFLPQIYSIKEWIKLHKKLINPKDKLLIFTCECRGV